VLKCHCIFQGDQRLKTTKKYVSGNNVSPFNPGTFAEVLSYLRMCLAYNAGVKTGPDGKDSLLDQAPAVSKFVHQLLEENPGETGPVQTYVKLIQQHLTAMGGRNIFNCFCPPLCLKNSLSGTRVDISLAK
jgi:hypothetical protein